VVCEGCDFLHGLMDVHGEWAYFGGA